MRRLLGEVPFRYPERAREELRRIGEGIPEHARARISRILAGLPDPDQALRHLEIFRREAGQAFERIAASPSALLYLLTVFSYSRFLSETLWRRPEWLLQLAVAGNMHRMLSPDEYEELLDTFLETEPDEAPFALTVARFRRQQLLRLVLRDVLRFATLPEVTEELSNLAGAIMDLTYHRIRGELAARFGEPMIGGRPCGFSVIALGKLGARELNYSSDIDLMFLYEGNGETAGPEPISNKEFFKKVANQCTALLSTHTAEGFCYRVDLRLRPDGRFGEVCISLDGAREYYLKRARDWELQMLIKARVAAGETAPGRTLLECVEPRVYSSTLDFSAVEAVSETRVRIGEKLAARRGESRNDIKLLPGGIRDIEFLVQCLQRLHGGREPWVRHGSTLFALFRLRDKGFLSGSQYARLVGAYQFLRNLEHRLQFDQDRQTHSLPSDPVELEILGRKMPGLSGRGELEQQLKEQLRDVGEIYERVIHAQRPMYYGITQSAEDAMPIEESAPDAAPPAASRMARLIDQSAPHLAAALDNAPLRRGRERFEHFLERLLPNAEWLRRLDTNPPLVSCAVDLFEHSQYFGDQLLRRPELLDTVAQACECPPPQPDARGIGDPAELRGFFRRQMLHIQTRSVFSAEPIFTTLSRTSDLADAVIAQAYRMAVAQLAESSPPSSSGYAPEDQMMVIALGRLGMREFDLASDADLLFVLPDSDSAETVFWRRVAERIIQIISSYTGEGFMFTVDTRLRPHGREGDLVQSESAYKDYFSRYAEAWEGIAFMKSRGIAGNLDRATDFLHELQDVDWRRYGQTARSRKDLAKMRARLEKEQGAKNPLKAGAGGYYDIDFALMYLRLKAAGFFFKVLNTPERIDIIERMGHLDREDAEFLRDAATLYRAIDHGLRVSTGNAEGNLPTAQAHFEVLTELVRRWTPEHLHDQRLDVELAQIRAGTRELFNRLFGA
jgi:glutamate-ammonia-ligase adenylyltransferase